MSGDGKRGDAPASVLAPILDSTKPPGGPGGSVSGARNRRHLTRLPEWKWIRQAKAVFKLVLSAHWRAWLRFSSDPWHWWRSLAILGVDLTRLVNLFISASEPARVCHRCAAQLWRCLCGTKGRGQIVPAQAFPLSSLFD